MSDNQTDNSVDCNTQAVFNPTTALELAEIAVRDAQTLVWTLEEQLEEAKRDFVRAKGKLQLLKDKPTWRKIFCPQTITTLQNIYTICMQTGYSYALWNGRIYRAGQPGEGMVDTGMREEDIK